MYGLKIKNSLKKRLAEFEENLRTIKVEVQRESPPSTTSKSDR